MNRLAVRQEDNSKISLVARNVRPPLNPSIGLSPLSERPVDGFLDPLVANASPVGTLPGVIEVVGGFQPESMLVASV